MGFISGDRSQTIILGHCLDDFVSKDSKAKYIVEIVNKLDLRELYSRYSSQGGEAIDPRLQLCTWFFGYTEGVTSTRKLEESCKKHVEFIYISANVQPDHTSLSRFRQKHMDLIPKYFVEIVRMAGKRGLSEFKEIAVDGTKLPSVSSKKKSMRGKEIEDKLRKTENDIHEYFEKIEKEDNKTEVAKALRKLQKKKEKLERAKELLAKRKEEVKPQSRENHQINIEEPEARMINLGPSKGSFPGYNVQVSTDMKTHLIVSGEVVAEVNDERQFMEQYDNTEKVLGEDKERKYVADGGYNTHDTIEKIEKEGIEGYIGNRRRSRSTEEKIKENRNLSKDDFKYDEEKDLYICPAGKELHLSQTVIEKDRKVRQYKCRECGGCKLKMLCLGKNNKSEERVIRRDEREKYVNEMKRKIESDVGKEMMFKRMTTVEPVIGNIKSNMRNTRFRLKGLAAVNGEFMYMCIAHNLNKLFKMLVRSKTGRSFGLIEHFCYLLILRVGQMLKMRKMGLKFAGI